MENGRHNTDDRRQRIQGLEFGIRNAEFGKQNTKHKTPNTAMTFNPKSEIEKP
jgi:hypothetical protein